MPRTLNIFTILTLALLLATGANAQETAPQSPSELKDFRLDPKPEDKPTEPAPQPQAPPANQPANQTATQSPAKTGTNAPPVFKREVESKAAQTQSAQTAKQPERQNKQPSVKPKRDAASSQAGAEEPLPSATIQQDRPNQGLPPENTAPVALPKQDMPAQIGGGSPLAAWPFWAALLLVIGGIAFWLWRRRKPLEPTAIFDDDIADTVGSAALNPDDATTHAEPVTDRAELIEDLTTGLVADFIPEYAQLTLANLTIGGRLVLRNIGNGPIRDLTVRTSMISANDSQRDMIRRFHADNTRGHVELLGDAKGGEEIALALEIQQPRVELNEFDWLERRFMAPIILINLAGIGARGPEQFMLSCLIGRESKNEHDRMKPFHTDRGPRRFEGLTFHPVIV